MTTTLDRIQKEAVKSYTTYSKSLSNEKSIDDFLDRINERKEKYKNLAEGIKYVSKLINKITWLNDIDESDEILIYSILAMADVSDKKFRKFLAEERKAFVRQGLFKEEFKLLKDAIILHKEASEDVSDIILNLRKDNEFQDLSSLIDAL
jgi:glutaredoxin 2